MAELHSKEPPAEWLLDGSVYVLALRLFILSECVCVSVHESVSRVVLAVTAEAAATSSRRTLLMMTEEAGHHCWRHSGQ